MVNDMLSLLTTCHWSLRPIFFSMQTTRQWSLTPPAGFIAKNGLWTSRSRSLTHDASRRRGSSGSRAGGRLSHRKDSGTGVTCRIRDVRASADFAGAGIYGRIENKSNSSLLCKISFHMKQCWVDSDTQFHRFLIGKVNYISVRV